MKNIINKARELGVRFAESYYKLPKKVSYPLTVFYATILGYLISSIEVGEFSVDGLRAEITAGLMSMLVAFLRIGKDRLDKV